MMFFRFFLSLVPVCLVGWIALSFVLSRESSFSLAERGALSFGMGWGILTLEMFYFSLLKLPWNFFLLFSPWLILLPFSLWKRRSDGRNIFSSKRTPWSSLERTLILFLLLVFLHTCVESLTFPLTHYDFWDAWSIWGFKAKAFTISRTIDFSFFNDPSKYYAHQEYPLLLPLSETWIYLVLGRIDEQMIKLLFPLFYLSFLILFGGVFRRENGRMASLLLATFLATLPIFLQYTLQGYAELPVTFYYTLSTLYLSFWCQKGGWEDLWVGLFFSTFAAWTKNEGQALFVINALFFGMIRFFTSSHPARKKFFEWLLLFLPILLLLPWWLLLKQLKVPSEFFAQLKVEAILERSWRFPVVLSTFFRKVLDLSKWNLLWVGLLLFGSFSWKKNFSFSKAALILVLLFHLVLYIFIYMIHPLDVLWAMNIDDSFNRILLHAAPVALFLLGSFLCMEGSKTSEVKK